MTRDPAADDWEKLASLTSKYEADLLAGRLEGEGIPTRITRATSDSTAWLTSYGSSRGLFELHVPAARSMDARPLLAGANSLEGSTDRSYRRPFRLVARGMLTVSVLALIISLLLGAVRMFDFG